MSTQEVSDREPVPASTPLPSAGRLITWGLIGLLVGFVIVCSGTVGTYRRGYGGPPPDYGLKFYGITLVESAPTGEPGRTWATVLLVLWTSTGASLGVGSCVLVHWFRRWLAGKRRSETS